MKEKHGGKDPEIMDLYHGSSAENCDQIINSEEGFDMRMGKEGSWGVALYFAELSSCSNGYSKPAMDGSRTMILAKVVIGDAYQCQFDKSLRRPPEKNVTQKKGIMSFVQNTPSMPVLYDSIKGILGESPIYMVYSNRKAYPEYLITYM